MIYSFAAKSILRVWDAFVFGIVNLCFIARHPYEFEQLFRRTIRVGGRSANMAAPSVPNTKHVWRKHIDRDPRFIMLSNKLAVKEFVKTLGTEVAPPETLWVGHPDELPEEFYTADVVIKSTHGNGTNVYPARDKMTSEQVRAAVRKAYDQPHGVKTNEWGYLHVKREIFVEERVGVGQQLADLKVTTFGGVAHHVVRITGSDHRNRAAGRWIVGADGALALDDEPSAISPDTIDNTPLPASISRGLETATQIGRYFDRMRIDFLQAGNDLFLGEVTVYNLAGWEPNGHKRIKSTNQHWDLRRSWFLGVPQKGWRAIYAASLRRFCDREAERFSTLNTAGPLSKKDLEETLTIASDLAGRFNA